MIQILASVSVTVVVLSSHAAVKAGNSMYNGTRVTDQLAWLDSIALHCVRSQTTARILPPRSLDNLLPSALDTR